MEMEKNQDFGSIYYIIEKIESLESTLKLAFDDYKSLKEYNIFFNTDKTEYVHEQVLSRKKQYIDDLVQKINVQRALVNLEPIYLHERNAEPVQPNVSFKVQSLDLSDLQKKADKNKQLFKSLLTDSLYEVIALDATKSKMTTAVLKDGDCYNAE